MAINQLDSTSKFPQPSRPLHSYELTTHQNNMHYSSEDYIEIHDFGAGYKERFYKEDNDLPRFIKELLEEPDENRRDTFMSKLLNKLGKDVRGNTFLREVLRDLKDKPIPAMLERFLNSSEGNSDGIMERGINVEEEENKLERFKIKTVNVGGVVKEEEGHK